MSSQRWCKPIVLAGVLAVTSLTMTQAQQTRPGLMSSAGLFATMPGVVAQQVEALGARIQRPGKEHSAFTGQFVDATGNRSVVITYQVPGLVRVLGLGGQAVSFDGEQVYGSSTRTTDTVLETFVMDLPEGMFTSLRNGEAMRFLGRGFRPDARVAPKYSGPRYDIYEVTALLRARTDRLLRLKRYYFDSKTGLLVSTRYEDRTVSPAVRVQTQFSDWFTLDGSSYPGRVDRYENGRPVFTLVIGSVTAGPRQDATSFR